MGKLNNVSVVSDQQQVAVAAYRYYEKTRDVEPLLNLSNVGIRPTAEVDAQRMDAWKNMFKSERWTEHLAGLVLWGGIRDRRHHLGVAENMTREHPQDRQRGPLRHGGSGKQDSQGRHGRDGGARGAQQSA